MFRLARWLSTFIAAWLSLKLLQSKESEAFVEYVPLDTPNERVVRPTRWAGKTLDLTLFAVTRALDVIVGELWSQRKVKRTATGKWSKVGSFEPCLRDIADFLEARYRRIDLS